MLQTISGIYKNGRIILNERLHLKQTKVLVTFLDETDGVKTLCSIPLCFREPVKVAHIERFSRDELHER